LTALEGDRSIFTFNEAYAADPIATRSAFRSRNGMVSSTRPRTALVRRGSSPFFSNLLPEGALRDFLAKRTGGNAVREYRLLTGLVKDLPGAIPAVPADAEAARLLEIAKEAASLAGTPKLRFSPAGVQLTFSALKSKDKQSGLTIPVDVVTTS
jgi:serine/threonine-protein kinase HipA